jgi:hypothetical protein
MVQMRRVVLISLMLFSFVAFFTVQAGTASAASGRSRTTCSGGYCSSGEFCVWPQGETPPTCATASTQSNPAPPTSTHCGRSGPFQPRQCGSEDERKLGFEAGKKACETGGSRFPPFDASWQFKMGYREGYDSVLPILPGRGC